MKGKSLRRESISIGTKDIRRSSALRWRFCVRIDDGGAGTKAMKQVTLDLPTPPSLNTTRKIDWRNHAKHKTWREKAGKIMWTNQQHRQQKIEGAFEIDIIVSNKCKTDLDNILKSIVDFCKLHQFIQDDSPRYMKAISMRFEALQADTCVVVISQFEMEQILA